jgi:plasmid stabilization system protein ParE
MVQINWTIDAKKDLKLILDYISNDSEYFAELTIAKIMGRVDILSNNVNIGKVIKEKMNPIYREILYKNYRIFYKVVSDNQVDILNVFHSSRHFNLKFE